MPYTSHNRVRTPVCASCCEILEETWFYDDFNGVCVCGYCLRDWCAELLGGMTQEAVAELFGFIQCGTEESARSPV